MTTTLGPDVLVGSITKNANEEVRFDIRIFARAAVGDMRPTREGVAVNIAKLPEFASLIAEAEDEAKRLGLLPGRSE
jgi:hypothetical protein